MGRITSCAAFAGVLLTFVFIAGARTAPASVPAVTAAPFTPAATAATPPAALDIDKRVEGYKPYDGAGRYTIGQDDGVRGIQGLAALAQRFGAKPYKDLSTGDGAWQSERVIFRDVDTGATMVRYTNDRWCDQLSYFQGNWSADGKTIVFRRRPGMWEGSTPTAGPMAVSADGTGLRNVFRDYPMVRGEVCSPTDPATCYAVADGDRKVVAFDLATGKPRQVLREVARGWHMKISLDGKYLMNRADTSKGKGIWIAGVDGKEFYEIAIPEAIHDSYRFHPSQKKIMFWFEGQFHDEGFVQCNFDGSEMTRVNVKFDWNHGDVGPDRGVHCGGWVTKVEGHTWGPYTSLLAKPGVEYYDAPADYNGYTTWWPKDRAWAYHTRITRRPALSEVQESGIDVAPDFVVNRYRICYTGLIRGGALDCPNASPDGTKVLFNTNFLGAVNIVGVVARRPEPPTGLSLGQGQGQPAVLTWKPPGHHAEIAGYHVYRSEASGTGFVPLTDKPIAETAFTDRSADPGRGRFYAVAAVETSGLESPLSDEIATQVSRRRLFVEMDGAALTPEMWVAFRGDASNLHYIWMRKKNAAGKATLALTPAQQAVQGPATLWARVRGEEGAAFAVVAGASSAAVSCKPATAWTWVKAEGQLGMKDVKALVFSSTRYASAVDCICLTDDAAFDPSRVPRMAVAAPKAVQGLTVQAASPYAARLQWQAAAEPAFHHYNVYGGASETFTPDQTTLVASPDKTSMVDWGLAAGRRVCYRVAAVDRFGQEGPASAAVAVEMPAIKSVHLAATVTGASPTVEFDAPAKDTYVVWLKLKKAQAQGSYIEVKVDGKGSTWTAGLDNLAEECWLSYGAWGRFDLDAGKHTLTLNNKAAVGIDKVVITNDQAYRPEGHVNVLSGW